MNYRTDCSGFVSMAWRLSSSLTTASLPSVADEIGSRRDMRPGDILMWDDGDPNANGGHVVMFHKWVDQQAGTFWLYEQASTAEDMNHRTDDVDDFPSKRKAYKYGDGDGEFDATKESFNEVDGTEFTDFSTSLTVCWMGGDINAAASGLRGCYFTMPSKAGAWSLDGWVNWDENNDGEPPFGPKYIYGSPIINR